MPVLVKPKVSISRSSASAPSTSDQPSDSASSSENVVLVVDTAGETGRAEPRPLPPRLRSWACVAVPVIICPCGDVEVCGARRGEAKGDMEKGESGAEGWGELGVEDVRRSKSKASLREEEELWWAGFASDSDSSSLRLRYAEVVAVDPGVPWGVGSPRLGLEVPPTTLKGLSLRELGGERSSMPCS